MVLYSTLCLLLRRQRILCLAGTIILYRLIDLVKNIICILIL